MWSQALNLFQEYMGTGLVVIWFLVSLIYLWLVEKRKHIRILFIYVPVILLLIFFNPLFASVVFKVADGEIYYRILWLIPMTVVIAYTAVEFCYRQSGIRRAILVGVSAVVIVISGSYVYSNPYFEKAENIYHVPQSVVEICDAIEVEGREVMAVFPLELLQYVRQYSPVVCMPYGREVLVDEWRMWNRLYDVMEAEKIDAALLSSGCREQGVVYAIIPTDKEIVGSFQDYDFELFFAREDYVVYKDATVDLTAIFQQ